jgi:hypothetical protein
MQSVRHLASAGDRAGGREFQSEPTEDRQVGVEPDALDPASA